MKQAISFKDVKLTSNKNPTKDEVFLNSLHKYETRLQIVKLGYDHHSHIVKTVDFPMTHFVAITKCNYYNFNLRDLKLNKHAKSKWERHKQVPQQQGPSPEQQAKQAEAQLKQQELQVKLQKIQQESELKQQEMQIDAQIAQQALPKYTDIIGLPPVLVMGQ